jgi:hypothetical protein
MWENCLFKTLKCEINQNQLNMVNWAKTNTILKNLCGMLWVMRLKLQYRPKYKILWFLQNCTFRIDLIIIINLINFCLLHFIKHLLGRYLNKFVSLISISFSFSLTGFIITSSIDRTKWQIYVYIGHIHKLFENGFLWYFCSVFSYVNKYLSQIS